MTQAQDGDGQQEEGSDLSDLFEMIVDNSVDVIVHQVGNVVRWISPSAQDLIGWEPSDLVGRPTIHLWHPDDRDAVLQMRDAALAGTASQSLVPLLHKAGHYVWVEASTRPDRNGSRTGIVGVLRGADGRVAAEAALRAREAEYRLLAENAADIVFRSSPQGVIEWVSPSAGDLVGRPAQSLVGCPVSDLIHPDDRQRMQAAAEMLLQGGPVAYEARFLRADGTGVWLSISARPVFDAEGRLVGRVGSARNIEREVEARSAQRAAEDLFRASMHAAAIGMSLNEIDGSFRVVNDALCRILRRDRQWLLTHNYSDVIHPADSERAKREGLAIIDSGSDNHTTKVRLLTADGATVWARVVVVLIRDSHGGPERFMVQIEDVTAEHEATERLAYQAFHDPLTGLRNRAWILDMLDVDLKAALRDATPHAVMFFDLDNFKIINDSLGHGAGDEVLVEVAHRITEALRPTDRIGRFGGDEFVVAIPNAGSVRDLERLARRVCQAVSREMRVAGHRIAPSTSIGIAVSRPGASAASLLRDADAALFQAKAAGRSRWQFFDQAMHAQAIRRLTLEGELRQAIDQDEFVVHYQPIVRLDDETVVGHEALVRWNHPVRGLLAPPEFLPVAEECGLILEIGDLVLDQVCALLSARPDLSGTISVNKSPVQIARPGWLARFRDRITAWTVDPRRLVIEVTETAMLSPGGTPQEDLACVRTMGVGIHVDDFGTGYSSIALLRDLPISGLKLDASFTRLVTHAGSTANVLAAGLAGLAEGLGLQAVAEGIETREQAEVLRRRGWTFGQGYLFGRPAPGPRVAMSPSTLRRSADGEA